MKILARSLLFAVLVLAARPALAQCTYIGTNTSNTQSSSYTFSGQSIGAAAADRYVVVGVGARRGGTGPRALNAITVGGQTGTIRIHADYDGGGIDVQSAITTTLVTTGTTGDVVLTFDATVNNVNITVWRCVSLDSPVPSATCSATTNNALQAQCSASMSVPNGAYVLAVSTIYRSAGDSTSASWAAPTTEDHFTGMAAGVVTAGRDEYPSGGTVTPDVTHSGGNGTVSHMLVGAVFDIAGGSLIPITHSIMQKKK